MRKTLLLPLALFLATAQGLAAQTSQPAIRQLIADPGFVPVSLSRGQGIGDVYRMPGRFLFARGRECFPGLVSDVTAMREERPRQIEIDADASVNLSGELRGLFAAAIGGGAQRKVVVRFSEIEHHRVSEIQLRRHFDRATCVDIATILDGRWSGRSADMPLIVAEFYSGVMEIEFTYSTNLEATAEVERLRSAARSAAAGSLDAALEVRSNNRIALRTAPGTVIAVRPAFIPTSVAGRQTMGNTPPAISEVFSRAEWFDPGLPSHEMSLQEWIGVGN